MDDLSFEGRVAIVTGAGRGLGREYALLLAARGAAVVVNDLGGGPFGGGGSDEPANDTVAQIVANGGQAVANFADVGKPGAGAAILAESIERFGRVDIVINNAGISRFLPFPDIDRAHLDEMLAVHVGGSFEISQAAWPMMVGQGYGRIVMTSSHNAIGLAQSAHYSAAKAALIGLMRDLSEEGWPHGINVNAIMPGASTRLVAAAMEDAAPGVVPDGGVTPPALVAPLVVWLTHESCDVTGEIVAASGGYMGRVFLAQTTGIVDVGASIETVRDRWDQITDENGYAVASSVHALMETAMRDRVTG